MIDTPPPLTPLPYARLTMRWTPLEPKRRRAATFLFVHAIIAAVGPLLMLPVYAPGWDDALDAEETWAIVIAGIVLGYLLLSAAAWVTAVVLFLIWFAGAHGNVLRAGRAAPRHSTDWAIGSWFVPVVNFFVPMQALRDTYVCSVDNPLQDDLRPLYVWWTLWLASWATFTTSLLIDIVTDSEMPLLVFPIDVVTSVCGFVSTLALIRFMGHVTLAHAANERPDVR